MTKSAESSIDPKLIQGVEIITLQLGNLQHDESVLIISFSAIYSFVTSLNGLSFQ